LLEIEHVHLSQKASRISSLEFNQSVSTNVRILEDRKITAVALMQYRS